MTINEIMMRDMAEAERLERREEEMRGPMRDMRREALKAAGEIAGGAFVFVMFVLLAWLFLAATPDQFSAECECQRAEMEATAEK